MRTPLIILALISTFQLSAQQILDSYIKEGLTNNTVLQQKKIGLDKALLSLKVANGMFLPSLGLQGSYTSGDGGRSIALPVGDMLNPVYATLNQLTESNAFPQIENVDQNFFPKDFYDVKIRASAPIVNTDLLYNRKIQQQQTLLQEFEIDIYKRELIRNIKIAYYNYLTAVDATRIYESAMDRALENKRVNESLLKNGKGLAAYVVRSGSELEAIKAHITEAQNNASNAKLYFNFLLNRSAAAEVVTETVPAVDAVQVQSMLSGEAIGKREELLQLEGSKAVTETVVKMKQLFWSPKVNAFVDVGSQAERWRVDSKSQYYLFGLQIDVPLFAGFTNRYKIQQARLDVDNSSLAMTNVSRQLDMSREVSRNAGITALQNYTSATRQLEAAESYARLIEKGYKEGVNSFIEAIDARNQLTSAQLQVTMNQYKLLMALASYERETSAYNLNP